MTRKLQKVLLATVIAGPLLGGAAATAQVPEVGPRGDAPPPAPAPTPAPEPAPQSPVIITIGPDGRPIEQPEGDLDTSGLYHSDDGRLYGYEEPTVVHAGPVPELHVVRRGDTLWDISWYYFNDPWQWPKVWSYNTQVTNPHWIYPGDLVRLLPKGFIADSTPLPDDVEGTDNGGSTFEPTPARRFEVQLKQVAFVDQKELDESIIIDGSVEAKELLATGDAVYLKYPEGKPPKVGQRYSIYEADDSVEHDGEVVGSYVRILGELEVTSVKKDKRARAVITDANREIERGALVGPLVKQLRTVPPARNEVDAQGTIIAMLSGEQIMGTGEVVFVDLGEKSGLKVGNRMYVVRRGDAFEDVMAPSGSVGQDDRRFPARALGEVVIVDVGKNVSIGLITLSIQEMGVGDLVMMQKTE